MVTLPLVRQKQHARMAGSGVLSWEIAGKVGVALQHLKLLDYDTYCIH